MTLLNEEIYIKILSECKDDTDMIFDEMIKLLPAFLDKYPLDKEISSFIGTEFKEETKILFKLLYKTIPDEMKENFNDIENEFIEMLKSIEYVIENIQLTDLKNPTNELIDSISNVCLFFKYVFDKEEELNKSFKESEIKHNKRIEQINITLKNSEIRSYISSILERKCVANIMKLKNYKIYIINELAKFDQKIISTVTKNIEDNKNYYGNYLKVNKDKVNINTFDELNVFDYIQLQEIVNSYINIVELEYLNKPS